MNKKTKKPKDMFQYVYNIGKLKYVTDLLYHGTGFF